MQKAERVVQPHLYCFIEIMNRLKLQYQSLFHRRITDDVIYYKHTNKLTPFLERVARIIRNTGITMHLEDIVRLYLLDPHTPLFDDEELNKICDELDRLMLELCLDISNLREIKEEIILK